MTTLHLESMGHFVDSFVVPAEALGTFKANPGAYDLVVTDYRMPEMTGLDLVEEIWMVNETMPVVFMTGYGEDLAFKVFGRPARSVILHKPFRRDDLADALREVLGAPEENTPE